MYNRRGVVDACFQLILIHSDTFSMYMLGFRYGAKYFGTYT